eukprot:m.368567 g.368567  ORF g.368567 m.368567 type:complete len:257 (-) comp45619_c0_seq1:183-953(-)
MGGAISAVRQELNAADDEVTKMADEQLRILTDTAEFISKQFETDVLEELKNPKPYETWKIVGGRVNRSDAFIGVETASKPSTDITAGVEQLIGGLFSLGGDGDSAKKFQSGISSMISATFNSILGSSAGGAQRQTKYLIVPHGFAFYRVDVCLYKHSMSTKGFKDHYKSQTVAFACRGILDISDLKRSEIIAYASDMFGGDKTLIKQFLADFQELLDLTKGMDDSIPKSTSFVTPGVPSAPPSTFARFDNLVADLE